MQAIVERKTIHFIPTPSCCDAKREKAYESREKKKKNEKKTMRLTKMKMKI